MRWSQIICLFTVFLGITFDQALARPSVDPSSDLKLVRRGKATPAKLSLAQIGKIKVKSSNAVKTTHLKSSNYRQTAIKQGYEYDPNTKAISHNPNMNPKDLHADHVFEVQTALHTIKTKKIDPKHTDAIKGVLNHPDNLVMAPSGINKDKGQTTGAALRGTVRPHDPATHDYMKTTSKQALSVAGQLDKITGGTHFTDAQKEVHTKAGI